ncbi:Flp pilus assembly protein CpaB [Collinsella sp. zg1085]|uniref:Flp pilus assembly protein CpaB n=1 Tax=Collinsella sp. zg1085 TaxID=2844380 RepID=UPI001C0B3808|nr:Flp pilus assembly protein CpaB [Collinsella sp. zg1085]QWT17468.1 Flp pilus assembly protein CpaB [Collinsella sp. zg1085]
MVKRTRIILSLCAGVAAALLTIMHAEFIRSEAAREREEALAAFGGEYVSVVVASRDIDAGEPIDEGNVAMESWLASMLPPAAEQNLHQVLGKTATEPIPKRAVLCPTYFKVSTATIDVPRGMSAVSISTDDEHALGGTLARGDAVDVYVSRNGAADKICSACVADSSCLATGAVDGLSWVTLGVLPEHVQELLIANTQGTISLVRPREGPADQSVAAHERTGAVAIEPVESEHARVEQEAIQQDTAQHSALNQEGSETHE